MDTSVEVNKYIFNIETERLFIGEQIFYLFTVYATFLSRLNYIIGKGAETQTSTHWHNDKPLMDVLRNALKQSEIDYILKNKIQSYSLTSNLIEFKIIEEINNLLSGKTITRNAIEMVHKFNELKTTAVSGTIKP